MAHGFALMDRTFPSPPAQGTIGNGISSLEPKSVKKKLKDKAFAAKVDREIIRTSVALLGVDMDSHIQFVIDALKPHAEELGIGGKK